MTDGSIDLDVSLTSPFDGTVVTKISVPARWLGGISPGTPPVCEGNKIHIGDVELMYDVEGLHRNQSVVADLIGR